MAPQKALPWTERALPDRFPGPVVDSCNTLPRTHDRLWQYSKALRTAGSFSV